MRTKEDGFQTKKAVRTKAKKKETNRKIKFNVKQYAISKKAETKFREITN